MSPIHHKMVTKKGNRTEKWTLKMGSVQFRLANAQNLLQTVPGLQDRCVVRGVFEGVPDSASRDVLPARWTDTRQDCKAGQVDVAAILLHSQLIRMPLYCATTHGVSSPSK